MINMDFPIELAEKIVEMLHKVTKDNVNFMGENGKILASIQKHRIGTIHEGAKKIMLGEIDELAITVEDANKLNGVMPGYNGVVFFQNIRLGCIGLSGDPEKMRPLQQLAAIIVKEEYEKFMSNQNRKRVIEKVVGKIEQMSVSIKEITVGSIESFDHTKTMEVMSNNAEKYLENINMVLESVKNTAHQTKLLGFNAAIEAARAGDVGRGFTVVSKEISKLSTNSTESLKDINKILTEVRSSITQIAQGIRNSRKIVQEQSIALQNISESSMEIQTEAENLTQIEQNKY